MITAHHLHPAGAGERAVLQVNRFVYFVGKRLLEPHSQSEKCINRGKRSIHPRHLCHFLLTFGL